ncbi:hypothetical protein [Fischerella thermalis]|nr:hypothetical protein [Fischerella thermalis]
MLSAQIQPFNSQSKLDLNSVLKPQPLQASDTVRLIRTVSIIEAKDI